ncbi:MAG TPA: DUF3106 domain-containing protein [Verrucomicrobiae bacterium]|nr:DUF3106 domain-containing protein [Verrucomicrobiae bacterium]
MNPMFCLLLMLSLVLCCVAATHAQTPNPPAAVAAVVPPPLPPSPVDTFRKVLTMSPEDREKFLATLSADKRQIVMFKLEEYQGLSAEQREQRLRALQTRLWVRQLIKLPASNRVERLAALQPADRQAIEERLARWDRLPSELQTEVLTNEMAIRIIARSPDSILNAAPPPLPPNARISQQLQHWAGLSKAERTEILNNFQYFLEDISDNERAKVLAERPNVKNTLGPIATLPKQQRERYIAGMKRFAALTPAERRKFLFNAAQWEKMTPEQRESWRLLAKKLNSSAPPPAPPTGRPNASLMPGTDHVALQR